MIKSVMGMLIFTLIIMTSCSREETAVESKPEKKFSAATVEVPADAKVYEVGCGLCVFDAEEADSCESYVKIDGKVIPITGNVLDAHESGLCKYKGTAHLAGEVKDGKFVATYMKIKEFDKSKDYQK